jgi:hypothetical protein
MPTAAVGLAWPDGLRYLTRRPPAVGIDGTCCSEANRKQQDNPAYGQKIPKLLGNFKPNITGMGLEPEDYHSKQPCEQQAATLIKIKQLKSSCIG